MKTVHILMGSVAALALSGCIGGPSSPDEFRVIRKAPLTIPPDYNLRPPAPGESRPQELEPDAAARVAVFGGEFGKNASEGEKLLVNKAGADATAGQVRSAVDYETSQIVRKPRSLVDAIFSFGKPAPASTDATTVDPAAEAARLQEQQKAVDDLTGGGKVFIRRKGVGKLPGA